jgi:hypothetical protein
MASATVVANLQAILSLDTSHFVKGAKASEQDAKKLADRLAKDLAPSQAKVNALVRDFVGNRDLARAAEYASAITAVGGASKLTAQRQLEANRVFERAIATMKANGAASSDLVKHYTQLAHATRQAQKPTDDLGAGMTSLIGKARSLAGVFGVTLGAGALAGFARSVIDTADQVGTLATKMGVSVEAAQRFQFAARQSGADIGHISQSIVTMNRSLVVGDKSTVSALQAAGLRFHDIRAMKPEEAFRKIADAIGRIPDPMLQSQVAMELFGSSGADLLPMIREGSLKAADAAKVMSDRTVESLKAAKQEWQNYWDAIVVKGAEAIARLRRGDLGKEVHRIIIGSAAPNEFWRRENLSQDEAARRLAGFSGAGDALDMPNPFGIPGPSSSPASPLPGSFETKEQREARQKAEREYAAELKKIREEFTLKGTRKRINELTDAFRNMTVSDMSLTQLSRLRQELNELAATGERLGPVLERFRLTTIDFSRLSEFSRRVWNASDRIMGEAFASHLQPVSFNDPLMSDSSRAIFAAANSIYRDAFTKRFDPEAAMTVFGQAMGGRSVSWTTPSLGKLFGTGVSSTIDQLPQVLLQTLMGGGDIRRSLSTLMGNQIGTSLMGQATGGIFKGGLGEMLQGSFLGDKLGGMVASFIPGLGALLGPVLGKAFSAIGNIGANTTKKARDQFAKDMGFEGLDNLYAKLQSLGAEGQKLANTGLNIIGKKDEAGNRRWMSDVTKFFDRLEKVPGKVNELSSALGKFGGVVPQALDPLLDSILGNSALSADLRKQIEGMRKPTWQAAQDMASAFGIDPSALGGGFNRSRLADQGFQLKHAIDLFARFEGSNQDAILRDMADEFSELAREARRTNTALPKGIEQFVRRISEMGLLLDENGEQLNADLLSFAEIEDEYQKEVVSLLEQIRDLLAGPVTPPGTPVNPNLPVFGRPRVPIANPTDPGFGMPSFAGGTHGQYMDFGAGTPVMLHGKERVMTAGEGGGHNINLYVSDIVSFEQFLKQRGGAEAVVRSLPHVVERWGRAH